MRVVSYIRVSTQRQAGSGLGLSAQEAAVKDFAARHDAKILATFTEVESGRDDERPELARAITYAKRQRAVLVVAKLDGLARSVRFVSALMDSGVEFSVADMPFANRLTLSRKAGRIRPFRRSAGGLRHLPRRSSIWAAWTGGVAIEVRGGSGVRESTYGAVPSWHMWTNVQVSSFSRREVFN